MSGVLKKDDNGYPVSGGVSSSNPNAVLNVQISPVTGRVLVDNAGGGGGITSINGDSTSVQTLTTGTSGTDFAIVDNGTGDHKFNLPIASATNTGKLSSTDWTTFNNKGNGTVTSVSGTANRITSTGGTTPVIDISSTFESLLGKVANPLSQFASTTSAQLAGVISDETGSGLLVFATSPTLVTPTLGVATATTINKVTLTQPATGSTLTIADGKTLTVSNTMTLAGTDGATYTFPGANATIAGLATTQTFNNKRITKRVSALSANSATPAINTDTTDVVHITNQTTAITSFTSGLSGAPVDGDTLRISVTGTASVALTFGASFESSTVTLPTTTSGTTRLDMGFLWNTETTKWRIVAVA